MKNTKRQQFRLCPRCGKKKLRTIKVIDWKTCEIENVIKRCDFCKFQNIKNVVWENKIDTSISDNNNRKVLT